MSYPAKILLLGATFTSDNRGIGALATGAVTILVHRYPNAEISLVDYGKTSSTHVVDVSGQKVSLPLINLRFSKHVFLPNNVAYLIFLAVLLRVLTGSLRRRVTEGNPWLASLCEADMAVAVSGGDSFSDIYGFGRLLYMALPQLLVILLGKKLLLLPQTIGPFKSGPSRAIAAFLMGRAELVYSRDPDSARYARALLKEANGSKVRFSPDMGFLLEPRRPLQLDLGGLNADAGTAIPLVGFNVSGLLYIGGYDKQNMFDLKVDYRQLVARIIVFLIETKRATVLLIPHVFGQQAESDTDAVRTVYEAFSARYPNRLFYARGEYDHDEIKYIISLCDFFIGSRMHACIAALSQSVPALSIAYSRKFVGVLDSIGAKHLVADATSLTTEEILGMIDDAFNQVSMIKSQLQRTMPAVKEKVLSLLDSRLH